ncbi:ankyrin repeat domain-containing protein [Yaniella halotolerans]|uniref:ankyrin repeat domain-containing protein n=1 Tax=Yaniella halotolerans TaxID=225453 RepID=UPI0003B35F2F|nr:ankyrin repeat domain-containing protein [Yaniella halotolerans]
MTDNEPELSDDQIEFLNSLYDFAREGKVQALSSAIDQGIPVNLTNHNGDTFLILAAYREQAAVVNALIERHADVNALNSRGQSALTSAIFMQNEEISTALLNAGADPDHGPQSARATITAMGLDKMGEFLTAYENHPVTDPPEQHQ